MTAHELGATVGAWNALVRRARIADRRKLAALVVSSYADADGRGIHCGVSRLAVDLGCSYRTAQRYLSWLREVGLIELVREGNRRLRRSDEYRLIIGPDIMEHLEVLDPDSYSDLRGELMDARYGTNQRTPKVTSNSAESEDTQDVLESVPGGGDQTTTMVSSEVRDQRTKSVRSEDIQGVPPPSSNTSPVKITSPADDEDLRTAVTGPRASPEPNPASAKCVDGLSAAMRPDGKPECPICRRRLSRPGIEVPPPPEERLATVTPIRSRRPA